MKTNIVFLVLVLFCVGCSDRAHIALAQNCGAIALDPDVARDIQAAGVSAESFCDCASKQILALPEAEKVSLVSAIETMATLLPENEGSTERVFRVLSDAKNQEDTSPEALAAYEGVDQLGERLEEYLDGMRVARGVCPV